MRCQTGTSRTTNDGKCPPADGLSRVRQSFASIPELKVGINTQDFRFRHGLRLPYRSWISEPRQ